MKGIVASPDARFIVLMDEYVIAAPGENPREAVAYCLYALAGLAAYLDGIVQKSCLPRSGNGEFPASRRM
jgi:hypothetical protein